MSQARHEISSLGTVGTFINGRGCSDTLFHVLNRAFDHPLMDEELAAVPFAGGIMQHGYQCGMIWGAALAAGAQAYRQFGAGILAQAKAVIAAQRLADAFRAQNKETNCFEITELNKSSSTMQMVNYFLIKGGTIRCFSMAARYAPVAFREIQTALADELAGMPNNPASCSALLAQKTGASDLHTVMASGLAGGVGLSGGACGALGAAIWILGLNNIKNGSKKISYKAHDALEVIERFLKCTDYEFECSKIVGRKFENIPDHSDYVCGGGCSKIIELLARI